MIWQAMVKSATDAMKDSRVLDFVNMVSFFWKLFTPRCGHVVYECHSLTFTKIHKGIEILLQRYSFLVQVSSLQYRKMDFEEFCAAAISVHQLEGMDSWEQHARRGYEFFEKDGNRPIMIEELASVSSLPLSPSL